MKPLYTIKIGCEFFIVCVNLSSTSVPRTWNELIILKEIESVFSENGY